MECACALEYFKRNSPSLPIHTSLHDDGGRLSRWVEHIKETVNCWVNANFLFPNACSPQYSLPSFYDEDLSAPLSEVEIQTSISKLRPGRAQPGWNFLGDAMTARVRISLKTIFDTI